MSERPKIQYKPGYKAGGVRKDPKPSKPIPKRKPPTDKQELFIQKYIELRNVVQAYKAAGYQSRNPDVQAYKLFNKEHIQYQIQLRLKEMERKHTVTVEGVVASFQRIAEQAESEGNYLAALRAYENLAKYLGLFTEKVQIEARHKVEETREETDEKIKRLIALHPHLGQTAGSA